jgi:hypothetical protein
MGTQQLSTVTHARDVVSAIARQIRGKIGQRQFAKELKVSRDVISRTESGARLNRPYLLKLAERPGPHARQLAELIDDIPDGRSAAQVVTIAEVAVSVAREHGVMQISWGDAHVLDDVAKKAQVKGEHPLARWDNVLKGLKRSPDLWEAGYIRGHNRHGKPARVRSFKLLK